MCGLVVSLSLAGCSSIHYALQSAKGQINLLWLAKPIEQWTGDPETSDVLKARLIWAQQTRQWAVTALQLPDNASYRRYADLQRPYAVWNVVAAPELSLKLVTHCFPVAGCVGYRGFFSQEAAQREAQIQRDKGLDVSVYGVAAYSTLGWFNDPLLNTFLFWSDADVASLIFHELAHQVVYVSGDTAFNESFATAVERIGIEQWLTTQSNEVRERFEKSQHRRRQLRALTLTTRRALADLYASALNDAQKRTRKAEILAQMRQSYKTLKALPEWQGYNGYDQWMMDANNASLSIQGSYEDGTTAFLHLYEEQGRDLTRFYQVVKELAKLSPDQRRLFLNSSS